MVCLLRIQGLTLDTPSSTGFAVRTRTEPTAGIDKGRGIRIRETALREELCGDISPGHPRPQLRTGVRRLHDVAEKESARFMDAGGPVFAIEPPFSLPRDRPPNA